jgi:AraC-like DNA-binding protein
MKSNFGLLIVLVCSSLVSSAQPNLEKQFRKGLSLLSTDANQADSVAEQLLDQLVLSPASHDSLYTKAYYLKAMASFYQSRLLLAEQFFNQAIAKSKNWAQGKQYEETSINNLGIIYYKQDRLTLALDAYMKSLKYAEQSRDSSSIVQSWINISLLEHKRNNNRKALDIGYQVLDYTLRKKDSLSMALCHQNLYLFKQVDGFSTKADYHYKEALALYDAMGDIYDKISLQLNKVRFDFDKKQYAVSENLIFDLLPVAKQRGFNEFVFQAYLYLGMINLYSKNNVEKAEEYLTAAENIIRETGKNDGLIEVYYYKARLAVKQNNEQAYESAINQYKQQLLQTFRDDADDSYEQISVIYELNRNRQIQLELEADLHQKKRQLRVFITLFLLVSIATSIILYQHIRLRRYTEKLFQMNVSETKLTASPKSPTDTTDAPTSAAATDPSELRYRAILQLLESEQLYLDTTLNIQMLSQRLSTNPRYISQAINTYSGTNFAGLVNRMRVNQARRLILENYLDCSMKEVADACGFNSRASFYRHFKEVTGFSPTEFKEMAHRSFL